MSENKTKANKEFMEKVRKLQDQESAKRTDYQKAIDSLKAHGGYTETKEKILRIIREANVKDPEDTLNQLIAEDKIVYDSKAFMFPYTLRFVATREEKEDE